MLKKADFPAAGYALHVDAAIGPHGPIHDAVLVVEQGAIKQLCAATEYHAPVRRLPGTVIMPGIHHQCCLGKSSTAV